MIDQLVEAAERHGIYLQLCFITRDLYMNRLRDSTSRSYEEAISQAKNLARYVAARWGYSTQIAAWEYFNEIDPGLPTDRFYAALADYLDEVDVHGHLRTTSTWHPSARDCRHPRLDIAQTHHYLLPSQGEAWKDEVAAVLEQARFLRTHAPRKPAMIAEFGLADDKWGASPYLKQDQRLVHVHNSLWASALSGCSSTVMFWWWELLDAQNVYPQYRPLAEFLADVPWTSGGVAAVQATLAPPRLRLVGLKHQQGAHLWLQDREATWWNLVAAKKPYESVEGGQLQLEDFPAGKYRVLWWDTWRGRPLREEQIVCENRKLQLTLPKVEQDLACKLLLESGPAPP
jgi:hypothetical protein